jgi:sugar phosphate isomerase/epimerase
MRRIGFSTLGCPDWPFDTVVEMADRWAVDQLEIRFLNGRVIAADTPSTEITAARFVLDNAEVEAGTLATGVHLAKGLGARDDLMRLLDIAATLKCRRLRVFAGGAEPNPSIEGMADTVRPVLAHAEALGLCIGIETHDHLKSAHNAARLVAAVAHPRFGIIWDTVHTASAGETPAESWVAMAGNVIEVQVKDALLRPTVRPMLLGQGEVDWRGALATVVEAGFSGPFVLEWEKAWHPELEGPELATPYELRALRDALSALAA